MGAVLTSEMTPTLPSLRPWQLQALRAWAAAEHRGVVEAVTGSGKTMVGVHAMNRCLGNGGEVLVLVPTIDLAQQWLAKCAQLLGASVSIGVVGAGSKDARGASALTISTVQSAYRSPLVASRPASLLIADEVHRLGADQFGLSLDASWRWRLGLTATWVRPDGAHETVLRPYFGPPVYSLGYEDAVAAGTIAPFEVVLGRVVMGAEAATSYSNFDNQMQSIRGQLQRMRALRGGGGSYVAQIARLCRGRGTAATLAGRYMAAYNGRSGLLGTCTAKLDVLAAIAPALAAAARCIVFNQTVPATLAATKVLTKAGLNVGAFHGSLDRSRRARMLAGFKEGSPQTLCAPKVLDEGVDVPEANLGIIMAASGSQRQMVQRMGRIIRPKAGKPARLLVLYCAGTVEDPAQGAHRDFLAAVQAAGAQPHWMETGSAQQLRALSQLLSART